MKRQLTPEQEAKKKARREKFSALWKQVAAMPELERVQLANKLGIVTCEGHELSLCNTMLIAIQCPTASIVGGFRQWLAHGRAVMKGQHGSMIWVPVNAKKGEATPTEPAPAANGEAEAPDRRFIIGTVFDIGQTQEIGTGEPLTESGESEVAETPVFPPAPLPVVPAMPKPKLVRLDDETRQVLLDSTIDGNRLTLPGQLDRALYMRVAKAIEAAGGKWNRKEKCHLFPNPVRETLDINPESVAVVNVQQTFQAFNTPMAIAEQAADLADLVAGDRVLEPSAGTGSLVYAIRSRGIFRDDLTAVEINPAQIDGLIDQCGKVVCGDFLAHNGDLGKFDKVIMNPPFSNDQDIAHIKHALTFLNPGGRLVAICGAGPRQQAKLRPLASDWIELPEGTFAESGTNVRTVLLSINV